jgi:hypothetical protein
MTNNGIVQIHGKDYMTVARRVELAQESKALEGVETEVLSHDPVVVRAKVTIRGTVYTGISAVDLNSARVIEKQNPYEVAETSAVGRALGFAGYGLLESIASADEVTRAVALQAGEKTQATDVKEDTATCEVCGATAIEKKGKTRAGKQYHGIFCSTENRSHTRWLWN